LADYLGNINILSWVPDKNRTPSFTRTRATDCDLFPFGEKSAAGKLSSEDFLENTPNPYMQNLAKKFGNFLGKVKKGITEVPEKLVNHKLTSLIQPGTKYPIDVKNLSPKIKIEVLKLYKYAQKEGIDFQIGQASRPEPQQEEMRHDPKIRKYAAKCSPHVRHIAVDIHIAGKDIEDAQPDLKKLGKYWENKLGHRWGKNFGEPWHFDLVPKGHVPICLDNTNKVGKTEV